MISSHPCNFRSLTIQLSSCVGARYILKNLLLRNWHESCPLLSSVALSGITMSAICRSTAFLGILCLLATPLPAQYIPPITDLDLYSMLAPCAASAISENISKFSSKSACPTGDRQLQSCVCSQSELLSQVSRNVSAAVLRDCGSSATDDIWSAFKALELYCSPGATITFLTPTTNIVDAKITNVPEFSLLAGCAQFAIQYGLMYDVRILPNTISLQRSQWRIRTNCV